jgi:membrane peptidoglycan carboxypeptidase
VIYQAGQPQTTKVWSPQAAWLMANILEGNTNPADNIEWGPRLQLNNGPGGAYRPAAAKTGTTNDVRDLSTYGLLPKPDNPNQPAVAVGVWMGNSDHSPANGSAQVFSIDGPGMVWHAFLRDYMAGKPVTDFQRPSKGLTEEPIDAFSGGKPGPWTQQTVNEWFITGTEPTAQNPVDPPGIIYTQQCGQWMVDLTKSENKGAPSTWIQADKNWSQRAAQGPGVGGQYGTATTYFFQRSSWGGPIYDGQCSAPSPSPSVGPNGPPTPTPTPTPTAPPTHHPHPTPTPTPRAHPTPTPTPTPHGHPTPTPPPTKKPHSPRPPASAAPGDASPAPAPGSQGFSQGGAASTSEIGTTSDPVAESDLVQARWLGSNVDDSAPSGVPHPVNIAGIVLPATMPDAGGTTLVRIGRRRRRHAALPAKRS